MRPWRRGPLRRCGGTRLRGVPGVIDVVALDMNKGWPNIGFDSILFAVRDAVCDFAALLENAGLRVRVLTVDVRSEKLKVRMDNAEAKMALLPNPFYLG